VAAPFDRSPRLLESIAGDLEEGRGGGWRATAAVWWQAALIAAAFAWERIIRGRLLPPVADEARRRARAIESVRQDAGFAVRLLWRQPGLTAAVLALALGLGANTAIFSVVDAVLWRPLPFADAGSILSLAERRPREGSLNGPVSPADFYDWRGEASSFSDMAAYRNRTMNLTGAYGVMSQLVGQRTREMGLRMALGATARQVTILVLAQAGLMMLAGIGTGIVAAFALSRAMTSLLFGVSAADPFVYVAVAVLVLAAGLLAVAVPCRRAAAIDPLTAMRHD
jgi:hypothetical protein